MGFKENSHRSNELLDRHPSTVMPAFNPVSIKHVGFDLHVMDTSEEDRVLFAHE